MKDMIALLKSRACVEKIINEVGLAKNIYHKPDNKTWQVVDIFFAENHYMYAIFKT